VVPKGLRVLAVSPVSGYGGFNTSIHRVRALESLGCKVDVIDSAWGHIGKWESLGYRLRNRLFRTGLPVALPDIALDGPRLIRAVQQTDWDVLWLEKTLTLDAEVLKEVRQLSPELLIIGFSPDDMFGRHNQSQQFLEALRLYDVYLTTKSYNVVELQRLGCPKVLFVGNGYDPTAFRLVSVSMEDRERLGGDIGFIGSYEEERAAMMHYLAVNGLTVRIWGEGWNRMKRRHERLTLENRPLYGDDFPKACVAFKINLGFLRKMNRDLQTTRSVEIPACGGFMLAERTQEHQELFEEGNEAGFFDTPEELLEKCRYYLAHSTVRERIALAGRQRCVTSRYSNEGRLATVLPGLLHRTRANNQRSML